MANLVIAAIPREDDYVHKISSEKVAHCTLLFLGDAVSNPNVARIMLFLEHAVTLWERGPFMLDVDRRGTLGEDEADVLFFKKSWSLNELAIFRNQLLKNNDIRNAYESAPQFEGEWNAHLTLGYPETPARADTREFPGIRWVEFDRIALWFGDYEGPEFQLEYNYDLTEVMMGTRAQAGEEFIRHYGVRGMKWGVRKDIGAGARDVRLKTGHTVTGKTKVKTKGGQLAEVSDDAIKKAVTRQKMKRSGVDALSNKELQDLATRMNLEQQVRSLGAKAPKTTGQKAVEKVLEDPAKSLKTVKDVSTGVGAAYKVVKAVK